MNNVRILLAVWLLSSQVCSPVLAEDPAIVEATWKRLQSSDGSMLTARHEAAAVVVGKAIYLIAGRGNRPVERYSPVTGHWESLGLAPVELHHVQPVVVGTEILLLGAFTCCYPEEQIVSEIHVFDTVSNTWSVQGSLPVERARGSAAAVLYQGRIYLLGGNTRGHRGGAVAWFDEYDPATGEWRMLPDAPNARDHFSAVMIGSQLVAAAGRQTTMPNPADNPVAPVDIYDFETGIWRSAANIPTARSGAVAVAHGDDVIVLGGEINTSEVALSVVEAYEVRTDRWRALNSMLSGRHGSGGGVIDDRLYMLSGAIRIGGSDESTNAEYLQLPAVHDASDSGHPVGDPDAGTTSGGDSDDQDGGEPDAGDSDAEPMSVSEHTDRVAMQPDVTSSSRHSGAMGPAWLALLLAGTCIRIQSVRLF